MKTLCTIESNVPGCQGQVEVVQWDKGDPFPQLGPSVGVDTETELITDVKQDPPIVVLGVFDPASMKCYVVYWHSVVAFMKELCSRDIEQRYFNVGFDEQVIDNEYGDDDEYDVLHATDMKRVRDMQIRIHLHEIATRGDVRFDRFSLADCSKALLGIELDKGDGTESSARLSFKRYREDGSENSITDEQARYLPFDCMSTWALGEVVPAQPSEEAHTMGMIVLAHIRSNGLPVDMDVFNAMEQKLLKDRDKYRDELISFGFPDPYYDASTEAADIDAAFMSAYEGILALNGLRSGIQSPPSKCCLRYAILYLYAHEQEPDEVRSLADDIKTVMEWDRTSLRKAEKDLYNKLCEASSLHSVDNMTRDICMKAYVAEMMKVAVDEIDKTGTYSFDSLVASADEMLDAHQHWYATTPKVGPRKFFQDHVSSVIENHPGLELETTEKSGDIRLTLKDMWRLQDMDIKDKFLVAHTGFKHCDKMLSTYLNRDFIKADGKVHAKFRNVLRTGRTSCSSPNIQNLPSRDKEYPIKNIYCPYDGMILCATDFSFVELVSLAESCVQRFGFSVMGDIINAGVDPHRWFAGVRAGIIPSDTEFTKDSRAVEEMNAFLEENITKEARQHSKAANFGLPGGMSANRFWINCREQGIVMSMDEAAALRDKWISTFREMEYHMQPEKMPAQSAIGRAAYGYTRSYDDDETEQEDTYDRSYQATLVNGMKRSNCSYCAAMNFQFQGLTAYGVKLAMWNLAKIGMLPRLVNMIHDEVLYCLYPNELKAWIPVIEEQMVAGMKMATPHIKVGVETSCMLHWDKGAVEFNKLEWTDDGMPIIEEPEFVKNICNR